MLLITATTGWAGFKKIEPARNVVIISAFEPILFGQRIGFGELLARNLMAQGPVPGVSPLIVGTAAGIVQQLGNDGWYAGMEPYDVNAHALRLATDVVAAGRKLVDGRDVGILGDIPPLGIRLSEDELAIRQSRLVGLSKETGADFIVILHSAKAGEWIQKTGKSIYGMGHFYSHFEGVYCVMAATIFDCKKGKFIKGPVVKHARRPSGVTWHKTWAEYPEGEKRALLRELEMVVAESLPVLLEQLGLAAKRVPALPTNTTWGGVETLCTFVPKGDVIDLPRWASPKQFPDAAVAAFKRHGWVVVETAEDRIVGVHTKGSKVAVAVMQLKDRAIEIRSEGYKLDEKGNRVPAKPYQGWHENLKHALVGALMQVEEIPAAPQGG